MTIVHVILALVVIIAGLSWITTATLIMLARQRPFITSLTERALSAVFKSFGSTLIAIVVLNSYQHWFHLDRPWSTVVIGLALLALEVPALVWLFLYLDDRFGR